MYKKTGWDLWICCFCSKWCHLMIPQMDICTLWKNYHQQFTPNLKNPVLYISLTKYFIGWKELPQGNFFFLIVYCNFHEKAQSGCYILRVGRSKRKEEAKPGKSQQSANCVLYREKRFPVTLVPGAPAWLKSILLLGGSLCACLIEWKECRGKMRTQIHVLAATWSIQ